MKKAQITFTVNDQEINAWILGNDNHKRRNAIMDAISVLVLELTGIKEGVADYKIEPIEEKKRKVS